MNSLLKISETILSERKKWSQQLLADYAGLNRTTIGKFERGDYDDVGLMKIERILNLFNKSLMVTDTGLLLKFLSRFVLKRSNIYLFIFN